MVDRISLLDELLEHELNFQVHKKELVLAYLEIYEHIFEPKIQKEVAQIIFNVMAERPLLDFEENYFVSSYKAHMKLLEAQYRLLRQLVATHIGQQSFMFQLYKDNNLQEHEGKTIGKSYQPVICRVSRRCHSNRKSFFDFPFTRHTRRHLRLLFISGCPRPTSQNFGLLRK